MKLYKTLRFVLFLYFFTVPIKNEVMSVSHLYQTSPNSPKIRYGLKSGGRTSWEEWERGMDGSGGETFRWTWDFSHSLDGAWFSSFSSVQPQRGECASVNLNQARNVIQQLSLESWTVRSQVSVHLLAVLKDRNEHDLTGWLFLIWRTVVITTVVQAKLT